eukprot:365253-Chlamydomonas_euryale.AAC.18
MSCQTPAVHTLGSCTDSMAPKNAYTADAQVNPEHLAMLQESERLKKKALDMQLLCDEPVKATRHLSISKGETCAECMHLCARRLTQVMN